MVSYMRIRTNNTRNYRTRVQNTMISGYGANSTVDRGAGQTTALTSNSPYYNNNFLYRYQQWANLYETSWEARKIIDIPVDDCMRQETVREGLAPEDEQLISIYWEKLQVERQLRRCLKQERLLGGSVLLAVMMLQDGEKLSEPLNSKNIAKGDLKALNVVDLVKLSRTQTSFNPFEADYDTIDTLSINGIEVHSSRMIVFDGDALFGRNSQRIMNNFRYNPLGFGDSKLAPLYDTLVRALGTQQAAYHLVNMSSILLMTVENLRNLKAVDNVAMDKLKQVMEQVSIYNAAIVDGKDVDVNFKTTSFGSVPELLQTYVQFLSAASDIPQTRFLGASADGMNATGEGDSRNYYDMVDTLREKKRKPAEKKILDWIGSSIWGYKIWKQKSKNLKLSYPPLWNLDAVQEAQRDETIVRTITSMFQAGMISAETAVAELNARELFDTKIEAEEQLDQGMGPSGLFDDDAGTPNKSTGDGKQAPKTESRREPERSKGQSRGEAVDASESSSTIAS